MIFQGFSSFHLFVWLPVVTLITFCLMTDSLLMEGFITLFLMIKLKWNLFPWKVNFCQV